MHKKTREKIDKIVNVTWKWTKIVLLILILLSVAFSLGRFYPNKLAVKRVNHNLENYYIVKIKSLDLREPEFTYHNDIQFVRAMHKCIDYINFSLEYKNRVPYEMIIAQAALESGWGTSRFAIEGNNLFGIRTWSKDVPNLLPLGLSKWPGWGVRIFGSKCDSVKEYVRLLNEHSAYKEFREVRAKQLEHDEMDPLILIKFIEKFSTTKDYDKRVALIIKKVRKLENTYASDENVGTNDK